MYKNDYHATHALNQELRRENESLRRKLKEKEKPKMPRKPRKRLRDRLQPFWMRLKMPNAKHVLAVSGMWGLAIGAVLGLIFMLSLGYSGCKEMEEEKDARAAEMEEIIDAHYDDYLEKDCWCTSCEEKAECEIYLPDGRIAKPYCYRDRRVCIEFEE